MVFKVGVEIPDRDFKVPALIKNSFGNPDKTAGLICDDSGTTGHVINERDFSKRIPGVVKDLLGLIALLLAD